MYPDDNSQQPTAANNLQSSYSQINRNIGVESPNSQNAVNNKAGSQNFNSQPTPFNTTNTTNTTNATNATNTTNMGNTTLPKPIVNQPATSTPPANVLDQNNNLNYSDNINNNSDVTESLNFNSEGDVVEEEDSSPKNSSKSGLLKLLLLTLPVIIIGVIVAFVILNNRQKTYFKQQEILLSVPMKNTNWQDIGKVFEPIIPVDVKTTDGYKQWEFLIDSGAVISSLPRDWAQKMGLDLALLRRSTFRGFGNSTSFAYHGEMTIKLGEKEFVIPVVFTEATGTKSLLGRRGFFQDHSVYFNHVSKRIEIRN